MSADGLKLLAAPEEVVASQVEEGVHHSRRAVIVAAVASEKRRVEQRAALAQDIQKGLESATARSMNMGEIIRRGGACLAARKRRAK